jgi:hypothetical protein
VSALQATHPATAQRDHALAIDEKENRANGNGNPKSFKGAVATIWGDAKPPFDEIHKSSNKNQ